MSTDELKVLRSEESAFFMCMSMGVCVCPTQDTALPFTTVTTQTNPGEPTMFKYTSVHTSILPLISFKKDTTSRTLNKEGWYHETVALLERSQS